nr:MAG TPA: hypothetical protein [Caudoviricetes sp.]
MIYFQLFNFLLYVKVLLNLCFYLVVAKSHRIFAT